VTPELWNKDAELFREGKLQLHSNVALSAGGGVHRRLRPDRAFRRTRGAALLGRAIREPFFQDCELGHADTRPARAGRPGNGAGLSEPSLGDRAVAGNECAWSPFFARVHALVREADPTRPTTFHDQCWGKSNNRGSTEMPIAVIHYPGLGGPAKCATEARPVHFLASIAT